MSPAKDETFEFEAALRELEEIVEQLDREGVGLDEAIALFEKGIARLGEARGWLESASGRIEELIATSTGKLETAPLDDIEGSDTPDGDAGDDVSGAATPS